jgi:MoaA/NifB/PqqE/SkfB family radical SAM enzyme
MYHQVREFRKTKPLFTMDFWNDGEYVGGCIAGGRSFLHINAGGDIEPCAFMHYADSNIRKDTLLEAYCKPLFRPITRTSRSTRTCSVRARCSTTPAASRRW